MEVFNSGWGYAVVTAVASLITGIITTLVNRYYEKKRSKAEIEGLEIQNARQVIDEWKSLASQFRTDTDNLREQITGLENTIAELELEILKLRSEMAELMKENNELRTKLK